MFDALGHIIMKSFMTVWLYTSPHSWRGMPLPELDVPVVVDGPDLKRVLLCGSGIVVGYGVSSPELALGGFLARALSSFTNHGIEVTTVTGPRMSPQAAQSQLSAHVLNKTDAVVFSFGIFDLLSFLPARTWGRRMSDLVDSVLTNADSHTQIFVLDCTAPKMSNFTAAYRRYLRNLASQYNDEVLSIARHHERIHRIEFAPEPEDPEAIDGRQSYRLWAEAIAPDIAAKLRLPPTNQ